MPQPQPPHNASADPHPRPQQRPQRNSSHKFVGVRQAFTDAHNRRAASNKPQPWIARKFAVGLVIGLWGYSYYVFVVRFCVKLIHNHGADEREGIAFIVAFNLLWLMFAWTYVKVILTSPGYAKNHARQQPRPRVAATAPRPSWDSDESHELSAGPPYSPTSTGTTSGSAAHHKTRDTEKNSSNSPQRSRSRSPGSHRPYTYQDLNQGQMAGIAEAGDMNMHSLSSSVPIPPKPAILMNSKLAPVHAPSSADQAKLEAKERQLNRLSRKHDLPPTYFTRSPPQQGILLEEYRYCSREGFVKPLRAHHCRNCSKCVLEYDHHCPWIGQCVGARNRKFFFIFLIWSTIFTLFTFVSLLVVNARGFGEDVDPQQILIIALTGVFTLFTVTMSITQATLIGTNLTTVEHLSVRSMRERERAVLSRMHGILSFRAKKQTMKDWNDDWGRIGKEGNIFWREGARENWRSVMGSEKLRWILPIGKSETDGLHYPLNPRFDSEGRWRPRKEWPQELR